MSDEHRPSSPTPVEPTDDPTVELLRTALRLRADQVHPADRFSEMLDKVNASEDDEAPGGGGRFRVLLVAACVALMAGVALPLVVPRILSREQGSLTTSVASTTTGPTISRPPSLPTLQRELPIYYVGSDGLLYREFRDLPTQNDRLTTAVAAVLNVVPRDPAYSSNWAGGQVNATQVNGNRITIDISESAFANFTTRARAEAAIQQVVYTAIAAVGDRNGEKTVQILMDGSVNLPVLGAPVTDFVRHGLSPLGRLWFTEPVPGATLAAGRRVFTGLQQATLSSPAVEWVILDAGGAGIANGSAQAAGDVAGWRTWRIEADLPAGEYTLRISSEGASQQERYFVIR